MRTYDMLQKVSGKFLGAGTLHLRPRHCIGEEEEPNHRVCERLDAASVNVLLLVGVEELGCPAGDLCWRPVLACTPSQVRGV